MRKYVQMALILLLITMLSGGCANDGESLPATDADLTYEYTPSIIEYSEFTASYGEVPYTTLDSPAPAVNIPPWQIGYIENLENLHEQPPYSYEIIVPFGLYDWISIRDGIIIAQNTAEICEIYRVVISNDYALLNLYGEYILPLGTFNRISHMQVGDNFVVVEDSQGNAGVYDFSGSPIIPAGKYQTIRAIHNNTAIARNDEGWGAINLNGNIIIPFGLYNNIFSVGEATNRLFLTEAHADAGTWRRGIRDFEGNVIIGSGQFNSIGSAPAYGMLVAERGSEFDEALNLETGEIVSFPTQGLESWDGLRIIKPGYAMTGHGIFNFSGERISPENLFFHTHHCSERWLFSVSQDNRAGIYDFHTNEVFWLGSGLRISNISYPLVSVTTMDMPVTASESAVLDFYGQEVIPFGAYRWISILGENRFFVGIDVDGLQHHAVVNAAGQEIIPAGKYGYLFHISGTDFLWMEFNDHDGEATGVVDFDGRIVFPQHGYLFLGHWDLQTDLYTGFANNHFFLVEDSSRNKALVRLIHD
ncbi:MAG: WG repeat-containing protein [Defluviitaleaceae bacterium]|nr:WG repeat-containing protein [Defluviitaleaceae bacterium]